MRANACDFASSCWKGGEQLVGAGGLSGGAHPKMANMSGVGLTWRPHSLYPSLMPEEYGALLLLGNAQLGHTHSLFPTKSILLVGSLVLVRTRRPCTG